MAIRDAGGRRCPETGLTVPECSCKRCLELMLHEFSPELIGGPIRVTRQAPDQRTDPGERHEAA